MNTQDPATELGLARYAVIAPLIRRALTRQEFNAEAHRITTSLHRFPDGKEIKVSARQLRRWVQWYREGRTIGDRIIPRGLDALKPISREDMGTPRKLDAAHIERAIQLRREVPERSTSKLVELIQAEAVSRGEEPPVIREHTLAVHLRVRRATRKVLRQDGQVYPRYEHAHRNDCWQGDMTGGIWLPSPLDPKQTRQCFLHAFIDDHTRYVPHAEFYFRQTQTCLMDCFRKAVIASGTCSIAYWDNGPAYQSRQVAYMAARLGIQVVFATPYHPQGKGKVERFFGHVKTSFYPEARRANLQTLAELNEFFWAWLDRYHDREHSELECTPRQRWEAEAEGARWPEPGVLAEAFLWEETRQVDRTGCVALEGNEYPVPEHLVGQEVSLRFDPFDLSVVRVYHRSLYVDTVAPRTLTSQTFRKALPRRLEKPAPLESSQLFREQLARDWRNKHRALAEQSTPRDPGTDCLTASQFSQLLAERLAGRLLTSDEQSSADDFFLRYAPLQRHLVELALHTAVEEKGVHRHLRFYLEAVRATRLGRKGGA